MSEKVMYPQSEFRYVKRGGERVLQQHYLGLQNCTVIDEWRDVPTVEEEQ